jgi:hypothetical protein
MPETALIPGLVEGAQAREHENSGGIARTEKR